jgi:hypothetical protein
MNRTAGEFGQICVYGAGGMRNSIMYGGGVHV